MKFFRKKKEHPEAYVVAWLNVSTGRRGFGAPLASRLAAERFAEQFNEEDGPTVYHVETCTPEMLREARLATFRERVDSLAFHLFDYRSNKINEDLQTRMQDNAIISLLCSISRNHPSGAVLHILNVYRRHLIYHIEIQWYRFWRRKEIEQDLEDVAFNELLGLTIEESVKGD